MGKKDNRRSRKVNQRRRQRKLKARVHRKVEAAKKEK